MKYLKSHKSSGGQRTHLLPFRLDNKYRPESFYPYFDMWNLEYVRLFVADGKKIDQKCFVAFGIQGSDFSDLFIQHARCLVN